MLRAMAATRTNLMILMLTLGICVLTPLDAHAQTTSPVREGMRVRVTARMLPAPLIGEISRVDPVDAEFDVTTPGGGARITLSMKAVQRIDVSCGRSRVKAASLVGGLGAAVGLAVVGLEVGSEAADLGAPAASVALGGAGATIGALVGYAYAPERWQVVYEGSPTDLGFNVTINDEARVKNRGDGRIAVQGDRDRRQGVLRGAIILAGIAAVGGGIDAARGKSGAAEYLGAVVVNAAIGGALGYLIPPRGWQELPAPGTVTAAGEVQTASSRTLRLRPHQSIGLIVDASMKGRAAGARSAPITIAVQIRY